MLGSIRYNLARLFVFRGRSTRAQFWPYAMLVTLCAFFAGGGVMAHGFAPVEALLDQSAGMPLSDLVPYIEPVLIRLGIVCLATIALLAAAVSRRLHDVGLSGFWGLTPVLFLMTGLLIFRNIWLADEYLMHLFAGLIINNILYLVTLIGLIIVLATSTTTDALEQAG